MGVVYRAHDNELDEVVALKILRADGAASDLERRFRGEIKLARKISHPNVCRLHEFGKEGPFRYLVMEYVEGLDLKRIVTEQGPLPPEDALDLSAQIAEALGAIHAEGIIHRDLKSQNVMRSPRGLVKVMDFGIAKSVEATATSATMAGQLIGTPEYMSPEQARGVPIDARSDIYALGIMMFELFTGEVPFRADTPVMTLLRHIQEPPPTDHPRIPPALQPILRKALAKDPDQRYQTAAEVAQALRAAREPSPDPTDTTLPMGTVTLPGTAVGDTTVADRPQAHTPPPAPPAPTPPPPPRSRPGASLWLVGGGAAIAVVVLGLAVVLLIRNLISTPTPPASLAEAPSSTTQPTPVPSATPPSPTPTPIRTPTPSPSATPTPRPSPTPVVVPPSAAETPGRLALAILPWARVEVDGVEVGVSPPLKPLTLAPGPHALKLTHPMLGSMRRRIVIRSGETLRIRVDLSREADSK
jgi:serine/threonine-protein kinase